MIDFIKARVEGVDIERLRNNPLLDFGRIISESTGEVGRFVMATYQGFKIRIYNHGLVMIQGSIHKYKNNGEHNYDDFTFNDLISEINMLSNELGIDPAKCILQNLEVGVNIMPPIETTKLLRGLVSHRKIEFKRGDIERGTLMQVRHDEYFLKAYDKGFQFSLPDRLFRWEVKFINSRIFKAFGIRTLQDLQNPAKLINASNYLINAWSEVLLIDPSFKTEHMPRKLRQQCLLWTNPIYWNELAHNKTVYRNRYSNEIKSFNILQNAYGENQAKIHLEISRKLYMLLQNHAKINVQIHQNHEGLLPQIFLSKS